MKKKICVVTGSRADYGLLYPLLKKIKSCAKFNLQIVACGMHLCPEFGLTFKEIEKDGFRVNEKVKVDLSRDSATDISKSVGQGCIGFADIFKRLKPDLLLVLGDRFEIFSAVIPAFIAKIPIAHIHGGELTEGAIDDAFRHSITKMSFLHFASTKEYCRRIIQLGESADRVFNVGALAMDNIVSLKFRSRKELENILNFSLKEKTALVTFHPATLDNESTALQFSELLKALDSFTDLKVIFTLPNADPNGRIIIKLINKYVRNNPDKACSFASLGRLNYLSVLNQVDVIAGNSSSGIIEAPSLGKPTVNIGPRQKGRIMVESIINCQPRKTSIRIALRKAFSADFIKLSKKVKSPYGNGKSAERIVKIISNNINNIHSLSKAFRDIPNV